MIYSIGQWYSVLNCKWVLLHQGKKILVISNWLITVVHIDVLPFQGKAAAEFVEGDFISRSGDGSVVGTTEVQAGMECNPRPSERNTPNGEKGTAMGMWKPCRIEDGSFNI